MGLSAFPKVFPRMIDILRVSRETGGGKHISDTREILQFLVKKNPQGTHKFSA